MRGSQESIMYLFIFCTQESQAIISFLRKAIIIKLCLSLKNIKPNTALFQQNSGLCSFTDMPCCFFGFYACIHGVTSAKNVVSFCLGSFRLLQQNTTDRVVFEQKCIVHGSGAWKSEMRRCSSSGAQTSHCVLTWWISVGWGLFYKSTNSIHESFTLTIESPPTHSLQPHNAVFLEIRVQQTNVEGRHIPKDPAPRLGKQVQSKGQPVWTKDPLSCR